MTSLASRRPLISWAAPCVIVAFAIASWWLTRPASLALDWQGWRQADTQTIARHLAEPGASIWYPRIDWGGAGPGYVEAEFQLYGWLLARIFRVFGAAEWPGQLVSLLAVSAAACAVWLNLRRPYAELGASCGVVALLASRDVVYAASSVQPEALCLLLYVAAWLAFLRYERDGSARWLALYALLGALAMLVKPTAAQLGVSSFLLLALRSRARLKTVAPWLAWLAMLGTLGAYLWHARTIHIAYGNTFGILSGGDSKLPKLSHLLVAHHYVALVKNVLRWGLGPLGALALLTLVLLRRVDAELIALIAGNALWTALAMRYTSQDSGTHYHLLWAFVAATSAARLPQAARERGWAMPFALGFCCVSLLALALAFEQRRRDREPSADARAIQQVSSALAELARPGELVAIRSNEPAYDAYWRTPNNHQDPRVFYLASVRGWSLASDDVGAAPLVAAARAGARFYVEVSAPAVAQGDAQADAPRAALERWLFERARLCATTPLGGRIFALDPRH